MHRRILGESIVRILRLALAALSLIATTALTQSAANAGRDSAECKSLDGYMIELHELAFEIGGPGWVPAATPVASPTASDDPHGMTPAELSAASARFPAY